MTEKETGDDETVKSAILQGYVTGRENELTVGREETGDEETQGDDLKKKIH